MNIIPFSKPTIGNEEIQGVIRTLKSEWLVSGPKVLSFEKMFSKYIGCKFIKILNSCTSALELAILSCNIKSKDEVITTPFTFCATVNAIIHASAKVVFADIDKNTFNIDAHSIERKITKKTKAILVMDYGGLPCDMDVINTIARKYQLYVIEDAAHAIGAEYKRRKVGNLSDITCFSFHATKNITTGEGGAIVTKKKQIFNFINKAYFHGIDMDSWRRQKKTNTWRYRVVYPGYKYNMSDVLAAIGIVQLKRIDTFIKKRAEIALVYNKAFFKNDYIKTQSIPYEAQHSYYLYPILIDIDKLKINRAQFIEKLKEKKIIASVHFIPIYKHPAYRKLFRKDDIKALKNTEYVYNRIISLPIYPNLKLKEAKYIADTVKQIVDKYKK